MKKRRGLVSNSSSSSFVVSLDDITGKQLEQIKNHIEEAKEYGIYKHKKEAWSIEVLKYSLKGRTGMDNFDMYKFMKLIGINLTKVLWEHWG